MSGEITNLTAIISSTHFGCIMSGNENIDYGGVDAFTVRFL